MSCQITLDPQNQTAPAGTDYFTEIVQDTTPQLGGDLDCQENNIDNVGNVIHNEVAVTDFTIQNVDLDKDIKFNGNDGGVQTDIMILDVSAGQLAGMLKATAGVVGPASAGTDYLTEIVQDTTPQLGGDLDCQENNIDNVGNVIHNEVAVTDFTIQNVDLDKNIKFNGNDGGVQTDIMILDVSAGQLSGILKATSGVVAGVALPADPTQYLNGNGTFSVPAGGGGGLDIWFDVSGTRTGNTTFTFAGDASDALMILQSLFTCEDSTGVTRRIGFIKSASKAGGTVTATVVTDTVLAAGDINFKICPNRKITDYRFHNYISSEVVADASNPQGNRLYVREASYLISVDIAVVTAAAGAGASCAINCYEGATNLFTAAVDLTTNAVSLDNVPTADNSLAAGTWYTNRVTASAGGTNKAADLTIDSYIVPHNHYLGAE